MANEKRLIDANALIEQMYEEVDKYGDDYLFIDIAIDAVDNAPTVDAIPLEQYNELKERYKKLLETADILDSALRAYQRKYGDLEGAEDGK